MNINPMGREYTDEEWAAAKRLDIGNGASKGSGPLIYATGPHYPGHFLQLAADAQLIAAALEREWAKGTPA